jgi:hypothetical protein
MRHGGVPVLTLMRLFLEYTKHVPSAPMPLATINKRNFYRLKILVSYFLHGELKNLTMEVAAALTPRV